MNGRIAVVLAAEYLLLSLGSANAQGFDAEALRPVPSTSAGLSQDTAHVLGAGDLDVGLTLAYAHHSLILRDPVTNSVVANGVLVANRTVGWLGAAFGFGGFLEARVWFPVVLYQSGNLDTLHPGAALGRTVLGDLGLGAKAALVGTPNRDGFKLALAADVDLPTGSAPDFAGDDGVSVRPRVIAGIERRGSSASINLGYAVRPRRSIPAANFTMNDQILGGLALSYAAIPRRLWVLAEAQLWRVIQSSGGVRDTAIEALGGARTAVGPWMIQGGAGFGLSGGVGTPDVRALISFAYAPDLGRAPPAAVAPPPPIQPPPADKDGDGVPDAADKCPNDAEDKDSFEDDDGCPDPDNDKDGVPDAADKCPNDAEDKDSFEDDDGCPDPDNDKDGVLDASDKCPTEAEVVNGFEDDDGCPDKSLIVLKGNELETLAPILFQTDRKRVRHAFYPALDNIAAFLTAHPEIGRCAVEGHTDAIGPDDWNQKLSLERAKAVTAYLVAKGVAPARITPIGHGDALPWASNHSEAGRAANRRVIFHIEGISEEEQQREDEIQKQRALKGTGARSIPTPGHPTSAPPTPPPAPSLAPAPSPAPAASGSPPPQHSPSQPTPDAGP